MKLEKDTAQVLEEDSLKEEVATSEVALEENYENDAVGSKTSYKRDGKFKMTIRRILLNRQIYIMLIPVMIFYIVYSYMPMYGITLAWKDYVPAWGIEGSPWVEPLWSNFEWLFSMPDLPRAIENTLKISFLRLIITFPVPILFSLLLNEIHNAGFKKAIQTMIYLPNFISWVILGSLVKILLGEGGLVNGLLEIFGRDKPIYFLQEPDMFYTILLVVEIWKGTGWGTIIYGASIAGIDANLYEAAKIDGCKRAGLMFRITLPLLLPIIAVMFVNALSGIMNAGFDPVYNLYNETIYETADIIDTYSYRLFMEQHDYPLSSAVGIFKTSINFVLLIVGNYVTKKISGYSMFSID